MTRRVLRVLLALFYAAAGVLHLAAPAPFLAIMPGWVPAPGAVVAFTGIAELAGAVGLLQPFRPGLRRYAGWGLAAYALCVWPANFQHMLSDLARSDQGLGLGYHIPRLAFQPVLIWLALWVGSSSDWIDRFGPKRD
ncbi:DoxX family protein [Novosphingobium sp. B 225]|uniref:DoxX family protein n=1 Tax=Novosphingobium sp. B 225 TaxID=1961849 RepID=UPI000B4AD81A|nr:DoxX family protein [Novosphingobium sp. B 225]